MIFITPLAKWSIQSPRGRVAHYRLRVEIYLEKLPQLKVPFHKLAMLPSVKWYYMVDISRCDIPLQNTISSGYGCCFVKTVIIIAENKRTFCIFFHLFKSFSTHLPSVRTHEIEWCRVLKLRCWSRNRKKTWVISHYLLVSNTWNLAALLESQ